jgi:flagellar basal body rod protein FlgG
LLVSANAIELHQVFNVTVARRSYEASSRVVQSADEMLQQLNNISR